MWVYPGGAVYEPDATRHLFFRNFFSDLGAIRTPSGHANLSSHLVFLLALSSIGIALILASSNWKVIVARWKTARAAGFASQVVEVIAGLEFIRVAATPWNLVPHAHNSFVRAAFGFLFAHDLCLLVIQLRNRWSPTYTLANAVYLVFLIAYVGVLFFGPRLDTQSGLQFPSRRAKDHRLYVSDQPRSSGDLDTPRGGTVLPAAIPELSCLTQLRFAPQKLQTT
jgi:hypothetical protein